MKKHLMLAALLIGWAVTGLAAPLDMNAARQAFINNSCSSCHDASTTIIGPSLNEIGQRYKGKKVVNELAARIRGGSEGRWGTTPHPPYEAMTQQQASMLAQWIMARKKMDGL